MNTTTADHGAGTIEDVATRPSAGEERRRFLIAALRHDAADDAVTGLLFDHVVLGRCHWTVVSNSLESILVEVTSIADEADWIAVADHVLDPEAPVEDPQGSRHSETGTLYDVHLIRSFLRAVAGDLLVAEQLSRRSGFSSPAADSALRAGVVEEEVRDALRSGTEEDWNQIAGELIAEAHEVTGPAAKGVEGLVAAEGGDRR